MKEQEIIEGNKLIAEFMGMKECNAPYKGNFTFDNIGNLGSLAEIVAAEIPDECWYVTLGFHSSWDWLMPVAEKCVSSDYESKGLESNDWDYHYAQIHYGLWAFNKEIVWKAIVEFIKWYNNEH